METRSMARARRLREAALPVVYKSNTTINNLSNDCLFHIFAFLPLEDRLRSTAVCKRWRDFHSESWRDVKKLDLIGLEKVKNPFSFAPRPKRRRVFNQEYGDYDDDDEDDEFEEYEGDESMRLRFMKEYPRLLSLCGAFVRILNIPVPDRFDILGTAASNCYRLTRIVIRFQDYEGRIRQSRDIARLFAQNKATLRSVIIDNMQKFYECAECLLELPEELVELQLWGYKSRFARYAEGQCTAYFRRFIPAIQRLKNLQVLVLNGLKISSNQLSMIGDFDDLRYLEIYKSNARTPAPFDIDTIATRHQLEYLSLEHVNNMDARWFADLVRNNPNLKHLKFRACMLKPEFFKRLFALSKLETLSLTGGYFDPRLVDWSGFRNLKKFVGSNVRDPAVIVLMEVASNLKLMILCKSEVSSQVLDKAHGITINRTNNVPLHIVVEGGVLRDWQRPERTSPLLTVENSWAYNQRTKYGYEGNEEELFY